MSVGIFDLETGSRPPQTSRVLVALLQVLNGGSRHETPQSGLHSSAKPADHKWIGWLQ